MYFIPVSFVNHLQKSLLHLPNIDNNSAEFVSEAPTHLAIVGKYA